MIFETFSYSSAFAGALVVAIGQAVALWVNQLRTLAKPVKHPPTLEDMARLRGQARQRLIAQLNPRQQRDGNKVREIVNFVDPLSYACLHALMQTPPGLYYYEGRLVKLTAYFEDDNGGCSEVEVVNYFEELAPGRRVRRAGLIPAQQLRAD